MFAFGVFLRCAGAELHLLEILVLVIVAEFAPEQLNMLDIGGPGN